VEESRGCGRLASGHRPDPALSGGARARSGAAHPQCAVIAALKEAVVGARPAAVIAPKMASAWAWRPAALQAFIARL
jgi:hypothetical protein